MTKPILSTSGWATLAFAVAAAVFLWSGAPSAQEVRSLRGAQDLSATNEVPETPRQRLYDGRLPRDFSEQPPLIPHKVDKYEIDLKVNQCLRCHGRPYYEEENAPKISDSHYRDREGRDLTSVSRARWFCNQCHVPQADVTPLISNTFEPVETPPAGEDTGAAP